MLYVMEFILVFPERFVEMFLVYLFKVIKVIRAFRIHAFVYDEKRPALFWGQSIIAVRTTQLKRFMTVFIGVEIGFANLAGNLTF